MTIVTTIIIVVMIIFFITMIGSVLFLLFTRRGKNIVTKILFSKKYVTCNLINPATDFVDKWYIVPKADFYTKVGKYFYNLNPQYASKKLEGRLVFDLDLNDAIPLYQTRTNSNEEIIQQVIELRTALENNVKEFLFKKQSNLILIAVAVGWLITIIVLVFAIYTIQSNNYILDGLKGTVESAVIQGT